MVVPVQTVPLRVSLVSLLLAACGPELSAETSANFITATQPVRGKYIVVLNDSTMINADTDVVISKLAQRYGGTIDRSYHTALRGFATRMNEADARALAREPWVRFVQEDSLVQTNTTQPTPTFTLWGLDRIDQRELPLGGSYSYPESAGAGVRIYVIDSGIRETHVDFEGRVLPGTDVYDGDDNPWDCMGHGTHVASTAAGSTYGVAKAANIVPVRVFGCVGGTTTSVIVAGIDWVAANAVLPAVVNMSLGGFGVYEAEMIALQALIDRGVTVVVAAGNSAENACTYSPAAFGPALTIGAVRHTNQRSSYSNYGSCVDLFAPAGDITAAWYTSDTATHLASGTSMASPHVAGAAALYLGLHPHARPAEVHAEIVNNATQNIVIGAMTAANHILNISFIDRLTFAVSNTNNAQINTAQQAIQLRAGDRILLGTCGLPDAVSSGNTYLRLVGPSGLVAQNNSADCGGAQIDYSATVAGTYVVHAGCTGSQACSGVVNWTFPAAGRSFEYSASNTVNATQNTTDRVIELNAGDVLIAGTCGVEGAQFSGNTYLRLLNPAGNGIAFNNDACNGLGSQLVFHAEESGTFLLRAGCNGIDFCQGTVAWTINAATAANSYEYVAQNTNNAMQNTVDRVLSLSAGQVLTIGTCGIDGTYDSGDTYLRLWSGATQLAWNDNACGGLGSQIVYHAEEAMSVTVRAGCRGTSGCGGPVVWRID